MKELKKVSRWITIQSKTITPRHNLYYYADDESNILDYFRWNGHEYALGQFFSRFGMLGFDKECKVYPSFITGYDGNGDYFNPLLCELDEYGERIRLYLEK